MNFPHIHVVNPSFGFKGVRPYLDSAAVAFSPQGGTKLELLMHLDPQTALFAFRASAVAIAAVIVATVFLPVLTIGAHIVG